jgi:hypothetical protein
MRSWGRRRIGSARLSFALAAAVIMALLLPAIAAAAPVLADSYSESNFSGAGVADMYAGSWPKIGQSFTAIDGTLDSCKFLCYRYGSPTGTVYARLYAQSGVFGTSSVPTGGPLAQATRDVSSIGSGGMQLETFTFDNTVGLTAGEKYVVTIEYVGGDASNMLRVGVDIASVTHAGNPSFYAPPWTPYPGEELPFYVYETPPPPITSTPASSGWSLALLFACLLVVLTASRKRRWPRADR